MCEPAIKQGRAIAYCVYDGHAYFYKSARTARDWPVLQICNTPTGLLPIRNNPTGLMTLTLQPKPILQHEHKSTLPEMKEWRHLNGVAIEPGHFFTGDLELARTKLLESGCSPKVTLHGGSHITSLRYHCTQAMDGQKGLCIIKECVPH